MTKGNKEQRIHYKLDANTQINQKEMSIYNLPFAGNTGTCRETFIKGERVLEYSVAGDITMEYFIKKPLFRDELVECLYSMSRQMVSMVNNGLEVQKISFDLKYMYLSLADFNIQMIYLPIYGEFPEHDINDYIRQFISALSYAHITAIECANQIVDFLDSHKEFNVVQFNMFIKELREKSRLLIIDEKVSSANKEKSATHAKAESEILYAEEAARNADIARMHTENEAKRLTEYARQQAHAAERAGETRMMAEAARIQAEILKQNAEKEFKKYSQTAILYADQMEKLKDPNKRKELDLARINAEKAARKAEEDQYRAASEADRLAQEVRVAREEEMRAEEERTRAEYEARKNNEEAKRYAFEVNRRNEELKKLSENRHSDDVSEIENSKMPFPVLIRKNTGEKIILNKQVFCIGRAAQGVDYVITDNKSVSRRHVYITNINDVYYLRDNDSTNHTYLNDKPILSNTEICIPDNSKINVANEEFIFKKS